MRASLMASAFLVGVALGLRWPLPWPSLLLFALAGASLLYLLRSRGAGALPALLALALVAGLARGHLKGAGVGEGVEGPVRAVGVVASYPEPVGPAYRFRFALEGLKGPGGWSPARGGLLVTALPPPGLVGARGEPPFRYGDRLVLAGRVEPLVGLPPDYRDYLAREGLAGLLYYPEVELVGEGAGNPLLYWAYSVRGALARGVERALPEPQAGLAKALALGLRRALPPGEVEAFRASGTSHLLALSGLHVGILLGLLMGLGRLLFGGYRWSLLPPLMGVWGFALLTGLSPSVVRASAMGTVFLASLALGRGGQGLPALALAAAAMVAVRPAYLGDVSFQLSLSAMAGLVGLGLPLARWGSARVPESPHWTGRALRGAWGALAVGLGAYAGTWPLLAFHFHRLSLVGVPATLVALPALAPAVLLSGASGLAGLVWAPLGQVVGWSAWPFLSYLLGVAHLFALLPGAVFSLGPLAPSLLVAYYGALALLALGLTGAWRDLPWRGLPSWRAVPLVGALALLLWLWALSLPDGLLRVTFLDVGQGDAVLVQTPRGHQVLVDGGPDPQALLAQLGRRLPFWDRSLDLVVSTHPHADHLGGLLGLLGRYRMGMVLQGGVHYPSSLAWRWREGLRREGVRVLTAERGVLLRLDDGVRLEVLNPPRRPLQGTGADVDNNSVVLRLTYGERSFLFTADLHREGEEALLATGLPLKADVLKVAHHGSATSTSSAFLRAVAPALAVISVGDEYGHPSPDVVERLSGQLPPGQLFLTREVGYVQVISDGHRLWVRTGR